MRTRDHDRLGLALLATGAWFALVSDALGLGYQLWPAWFVQHFADRADAAEHIGLITLVVKSVENVALAGGAVVLARGPRGSRAAWVATGLFGAALAVLALRVVLLELLGATLSISTWLLLVTSPFVIALLGALALGVHLARLGAAVGARYRAAGLALAGLVAVSLPQRLWNAVPLLEHARAPSSWGGWVNTFASVLLLLALALALRARLRRAVPVVLVLVFVGAPRPARAESTEALVEANELAALRDARAISPALARSTAAVARFPDSPTVHALHAELLGRANRIVEGRRAIERAIALGDDRAAVHAIHGRYLRILGELELARIPLARAVALDPDAVDARADLAEVERLLAIQVPGGQPPAGSGPARAVDELLRAAEGGRLGGAVVDHIHPAFFRRISAASGASGDGAELRQTVAATIGAELDKQPALRAGLAGYRIVDVQETGETASVRIEIATRVPVADQDLQQLRDQVRARGAAAVLDAVTAEAYELLEPRDREAFLEAYRGRPELAIEEATFQLRRAGARWLVEDLELPYSFGLTRSFAGHLELQARLAAGLASALDEVDRRARAGRHEGWHPLDVLTLLGTLGVLAWLGVRLVRI